VSDCFICWLYVLTRRTTWVLPAQEVVESLYIVPFKYYLEGNLHTFFKKNNHRYMWDGGCWSVQLRYLLRSQTIAMRFTGHQMFSLSDCKVGNRSYVGRAGEQKVVPQKKANLTFVPGKSAYHIQDTPRLSGGLQRPNHERADAAHHGRTSGTAPHLIRIIFRVVHVTKCKISSYSTI